MATGKDVQRPRPEIGIDPPSGLDSRSAWFLVWGSLDSLDELIRWSVQMFFFVPKNSCCWGSQQKKSTSRNSEAGPLVLIITWHISSYHPKVLQLSTSCQSVPQDARRREQEVMKVQQEDPSPGKGAVIQVVETAPEKPLAKWRNRFLIEKRDHLLTFERVFFDPKGLSHRLPGKKGLPNHGILVNLSKHPSKKKRGKVTLFQASRDCKIGDIDWHKIENCSAVKRNPQEAQSSIVNLAQLLLRGAFRINLQHRATLQKRPPCSPKPKPDLLCHRVLHIDLSYRMTTLHMIKWLDTPRKINMEPKNHLIEKETHLPNLHFGVPC